MQTIFYERMDTKKLRQKILELAIHGKLVPQDPNDEPASVLLERIRAEKERLIKEGKIKQSKKSAKSSDTPHYENEVPFEVPESWEWQKLGDIGVWQSGATPSRLNKEYYGGNIPWLKTGDLNDGYIQEIPETITQKALEETSVKLNPAGSVLIAMYGATIGKVGILTFPATTNQACCACVEYNGIEQMYLFYFLLSHKEEFIMLGGGGAQPNISKEKIVDTYIPIPPQFEQKRIINAIEQWFALIDTLESAKEDLQMSIAQAKSKILDLAIHGKLVPQDTNDEPAIELLKRINPKFTPCDNAHYENNTIEIPKNWEWAKLSDIAVSELGKTLDKGKNSGTPHNYLCAFNVKWCSFDFSVIKKILLEDEELERYKVRKGDLLICEGGDVGRAAIWESDQDIYYQNALHRVRFKNEINQYFYLYVLQYYKSLGMIDDVSGGVTIKHFTQNSMKKLSFPLPPIKEQYRIVSAINQYNTILDDISANL